MATIPNQGTGLRHVRKTIAFDGGANNGYLGDAVPAFTTTGRVRVVDYSVYVPEAMACSAPTQVTLILTGVRILTDQWDFTGETGFINPGEFEIAANGDAMGATAANVSTNITLLVENEGSGADVTDGTLVIDVWYYPITDDGALAGDDIDLSFESTINAQVIDVIDTDTYAEPGQEAPGATISLARKISYLYKAWRNKSTADASEYILFADDGTTEDQAATLSDDGTTFTRGEIGTGA